MIGTYLLVFIGPASIIVASLTPSLSSIEALTFIALAFGCTVASAIVLLGRRSGAHINPALTVANALAGTFKRELLVPYVTFQVFGAFLAGLSLRVAFGSFNSFSSLGSTKLAVGISPVEGCALEIIGTFVLAISALSASSLIRDPFKQAILVGATLFSLIMFMGPLTGASFNPARSFGPSLFSGYFDNQILYWVAPFVGAGCAGLIFGWAKRTHGRKK